MKTAVSVPGKIFLMGEHAVVYGKPAILSAINLRMRVAVEDRKQEEVGSSKLEDRIVVNCSEADEYVKQVSSLVFQKYGIKEIPGLTISIQSEIPAGYHLGSSAATAVGVIGALIYHLKKIWNPVLINQLAYEAEKLKHGNPSGADNTIVTSGGLVWYRKELEILRSIWQLPFGYPAELNNLYLLDTGKPLESTGEMVAYVGSRRIRQPSKYQKNFDRNEIATKKLAVAVKDINEPGLISAVKEGEDSLEKIGVVSPKAKKIIRAIEDAGGAAKILGGGGRRGGVGYLLCYLPESIFEKVNRKYVGKLKKIILGGKGIKLEHD